VAGFLITSTLTEGSSQGGRPLGTTYIIVKIIIS